MARALRGREIVVPISMLVAVFVAFAATEAGYHTRHWYPAALFTLGLLLTALVAVPMGKRVPRPVWVAVGLLGAYTLWTYVSISWSEQEADAWRGANRTLFYASIFALCALWPLRGRSCWFLLGAFALGVVAVGGVELIRLGAARDANDFLIGGQLGEPAGYTNANAALWALGLVPCLVLACRREVHPLARGAFLGGAGLLMGLELLVQSRGWALSIPIGIMVALAACPQRVRLLAVVATVGGAVLAMAGPCLDVLSASDAGRGLSAAADRAVQAVLGATAILVVLGTVAAYVDLRLPLSPRGARLAAIAGSVLALAAAGSALTAITVREGNPVARLGDAWNEFKRGYDEERRGEGPRSSRLTASLGTNRYDFWTLAWRQFREEPLVGIGADNFQRDYLRRGASGETPRFPHSYPLGVLSQTGLVGGVLLFGAIAAALVAAAGSVRRGSVPVAGAAAAGLAGFAYWLTHASGDWLWEFPGVTGPAVAMLGLAAAAGPRAPARGAMHGELRPLIGGRWAVAIASGAALLVAAVLAPPWLAERELRRAGDVGVRDAPSAYARAERAAALNPLSSDPQVLEGAIALATGDLHRAEAAYRAALERDPSRTYAHLQLAIVASRSGRAGDARASLERAARLSPRDRVVASALRTVRRGRRLDPATIERAYLKQDRIRAE